MEIKAILAAHGRDDRLDLFRGIANWFIFLDHIPNNLVNLITIRNFGFSGAAEIFIFIAGYAASIAYARIMLERGFIVGATRLFKRAWQLYAAYIVLFVLYLVTITTVAAQYAAPDIIYEFNVTGLVDHPIRTLAHGLFLESKPLNLDVLQLYIILMVCFAPVLGIMLYKPDLTLAGSLALYLAARACEWNLSSFPDGSWYFGIPREAICAERPAGAAMEDFSARRQMRPAIVAVFCAGVFLSFAGHFALTISSDSRLAQIVVSAAGVAVMTAVAYYISWSKRQDAPAEIAPRLAPIDAHPEGRIGQELPVQ